MNQFVSQKSVHCINYRLACGFSQICFGDKGPLEEGWRGLLRWVTRHGFPELIWKSCQSTGAFLFLIGDTVKPLSLYTFG